MSKRTYRKLGIIDLQLLINTRNETEALEMWAVDEESARIFLSNPANYFFACIEDDKIIGYICGHELNRLDGTGNMLYIHGVGVHAAYRQQGVGKQMMTNIKQLCKLSGIRKIFLYTHKTNTAACALYDSTGGNATRDDNVSYFYNDFEEA
ncbi:MAG: GNAT family N-acetyltransferase [Firmicutes bacterium]|nr:GNAT family N-acetyltransferase [Bacillota bacterium]